MDRTLRSTRSRSTIRFRSNLRNPFECSCSSYKPGVLEIYGREIVVSECPNNICGCKWQGELNYCYLLNHRKKCNFQVVQCHCKEEMFKGYLGQHLTSECKNRLVDYSVVQEYDDLYGHQECPRSRLGCKWYGTSKRYEEVHSNQCNYQDVVCYCKEPIKKWFLAEHIMTNCDLRLDLQPGTSFSNFLKPESVIKTVKDLQPGTSFSNFLKPESVIKTVKDKGIQCDIGEQQERSILELVEENERLKNSLVNICLLLEKRT